MYLMILDVVKNEILFILEFGDDYYWIKGFFLSNEYVIFYISK